ncbi:MAG: HIT family protein [Candidatus Woesearchaeota archaeon]|jgi:histidine triad (HIT) family protein|nr:HIT family protein [Candidatus Woesearchaeota archaeon]
MEGCLFCKIVEGEIPCAKLYEDEKILSFLDIAPANKGHALVMPKEHYETLLDVPDDIELMKVVKKVVRAMSSALGNEGFNILVNNKKVAGQLVPHLHVHIIPRFAGDGIKLNWMPKRYRDKEIEEFKEKIKSFL